MKLLFKKEFYFQTSERMLSSDICSVPVQFKKNNNLVNVNEYSLQLKVHGN